MYGRLNSVYSMLFRAVARLNVAALPGYTWMSRMSTAP